MLLMAYLLNAMSVYLFPFEVVPKQSKIVLCGAGKVGRSFAQQILKTNYCQLVLWVDKEYNKKKNDIFQISPYDEIVNKKFDYVVVAVSSIKFAEDIKRTLVQYGVAEEKMIYAKDRYLGNCDSVYSLKEFCFLNREMTLKIIREFLEMPSRNFDFFNPIIKEINDSEIKEQIKESLGKILLSEKDVMTCIVIIRIMYHCHMVDRDVLRCAVNVAGHIPKVEARYWFLTEIGLMEFIYPNAVYENYYAERRKHMVVTAEELYSYGRENMVCDKENPRIAILAMHLHDDLDSITRFVSNYANELSKQGKQVTIFLTEPFRYSYGEAIMEPFSCSSKNSTDYKEEQKEYLHQDVKVYYDFGNGIRERFNNCIDAILDFQPKVILDFTAKHSYLSPILIKFFPVVCVSTGYYCTTALFHKYICREKKTCIEVNKIYKAVPEDKMIELPKGCIIPHAKGEHVREKYGFKETDFLLVTVGNRLENECTNDFIDEVYCLLNKRENIKWILVGGSNSYIANTYSQMLQEERIIFWGYESDLLSFYKMCDAYLNPNRSGGGGSVLWAMAAGLPILATDFPGDTVEWIGKDNLIHGNYHDLINYAESLYLDKELCHQIGMKMQNNVEQSSFENRIKKLIEVCDTIEVI